MWQMKAANWRWNHQQNTTIFILIYHQLYYIVILFILRLKKCQSASIPFLLQRCVAQHQNNFHSISYVKKHLAVQLQYISNDFKCNRNWKQKLAMLPLKFLQKLEEKTMLNIHFYHSTYKMLLVTKVNSAELTLALKRVF